MRLRGTAAQKFTARLADEALLREWLKSASKSMKWVAREELIRRGLEVTNDQPKKAGVK